MSGYVTLLGVEDVRAAGYAMQRAAEQMQQAADLINESNTRHEEAIRELIGAIEEDARLRGLGR